MTLDELEKLADESPMIVTMATQHLKQLIALMRKMTEALEISKEFIDRHSEDWYISGQNDLQKVREARTEAIAVYEQMKEEKSNV